VVSSRQYCPSLRELPPIDAVSVTRDHYDHRDFPTIRRLARRDVPFVTSLGVGSHLEAWGDIHLGPKIALETLALLGDGPFLPVHWGTFSLAMHAWDEPPETLLELGTRAGVQLVMPRLGEPVEPAHAERVEPWWRGVDAGTPAAPRAEPLPTPPPKIVPWPID
jgi:L-ascorbate metabolism protein UlaG (beta-lactamase superfamily)